MTKIVLYIATSQDGFIADANGNVDWLPQTLEETEGKDYGYQEFYNSVDTLAIGRKTYEQIISFGSWPYPGKRSYIFSSQPTKSLNKDIKFVSKDIKDFIKKIEDKNKKKLWLVGGAELIEAFYQQGKIDEFIITVFPTILNAGIPLKTVENALKNDEIEIVQSTDFGSGVFQNHYIMKK